MLQCLGKSEELGRISKDCIRWLNRCEYSPDDWANVHDEQSTKAEKAQDLEQDSFEIV